jgi:hypothetical protein
VIKSFSTSTLIQISSLKYVCELRGKYNCLHWQLCIFIVVYYSMPDMTKMFMYDLFTNACLNDVSSGPVEMLWDCRVVQCRTRAIPTFHCCSSKWGGVDIKRQSGYHPWRQGTNEARYFRILRSNKILLAFILVRIAVRTPAILNEDSPGFSRSL